MIRRSARLLSLFAVLGFFWGGVGAAKARLGETMEECIGRYGESFGSIPSICGRAGELCYLFKRNIDSQGKIKTIQMKIEFIDGKAAYLRVSSGAISDQDARDLVDLNHGDSTWLAPQPINERSYYQTEDKKRFACIFRLGEVRVVELFSAEMAAQLNAYRVAMLANPMAKKTSRTSPDSPQDPTATPGDAGGKTSPSAGALKGF